MSKTILVHHTNNPLYRSMIKYLFSLQGESYQTDIRPLHTKLFESFHNVKPTAVFLPAAEYTQELHDFITEHHKNTSIVLLIDQPIDHQELLTFWRDTQIKIVVNERFAAQYTNNKSLLFSHLYDSEIFQHHGLERNNKVAAILSHDNNKNNEILSSWLYPEQPKSTLVLFNNPEFKHPQNIGIFNNSDLSIVLNTFSHLIDIEDSFTVEAQACQISNLEFSSITDILDTTTYTQKPHAIRSEQLETHCYRTFVSTKLISFLS
jgi:hypothetical protein